MGVERPKGTKNLLFHYGYTPYFVPWLRANVHNYDAAIVNGLWNYAAFGASEVLPHAKLPYFVFTHGMMDPWFQKTYPLKHLAKQAFWLVAEGRLMAGARSAFFTCEEEKILARGQFWGHKYKETVVGYGTTAPPPASEAQTEAFYGTLPHLKGRDYLLFLSRIHVKKGCDMLIKAFSQVTDHFPNLDLVIAGPDHTNWRPELEALAGGLGVSDRIHFPGGLFGDAKWGAMRHAEAFILPSHQENFGIVVAESLACGTPVLISDKVNIWREVKAAGAGLVQSDTVEGTVSLIQDWLGLSVAQKEVIKSATITLFSEKFDMKNTGPALIETIRELI